MRPQDATHWLARVLSVGGDLDRFLRFVDEIHELFRMQSDVSRYLSKPSVCLFSCLRMATCYVVAVFTLFNYYMEPILSCDYQVKRLNQ